MTDNDSWWNQYLQRRLLLQHVAERVEMEAKVMGLTPDQVENLKTLVLAFAETGI